MTSISTSRRYFYPRSPCGERRGCVRYCIHAPEISIHALLAESDAVFVLQITFFDIFLSTLSLRRATVGLDYDPIVHIISIHALLAESDKVRKALDLDDCEFLSTLSLRRATNARRSNKVELNNFYPRSPCGERPEGPAKLPKQIGISIHALLAESDVVDALELANSMLFLSTLSLRRATFQVLS